MDTIKQLKTEKKLIERAILDLLEKIESDDVYVYSVDLHQATDYAGRNRVVGVNIDLRLQR